MHMLSTKCYFATALINLYFCRNYEIICSVKLFTRIFPFITEIYLFIHNAGRFSYYVRKTISRSSKYQCDDRTRKDIVKAVTAHNKGLESVLLRTHFYLSLQDFYLIQSSFS